MNEPVAPRPARLVDIARAVGLSRAAVAHVLLGTGEGTIRVGAEAAKRIREEALRCNYRPNLAARQLRGKSSKLIAVLMEDGAPVVERQRVIELERQAWRRGWQVMVYRTPWCDADGMTDLVLGLRARGCDGVVVLNQIADVPEADRNLAFTGFPAVFHNHAIASANDWGVRPDLSIGTRLAFEHLRARGCRRIGQAVLPEVAVRQEALSALCAAHGIEDDPARNRLLPNRGEQRPAHGSVVSLVDDLIIGQRCDGVILENDYWAALVMQELRRRGMAVPQQVALIGYNDLDFAEFVDPPLTTINENEQDLASALLDALLGQIGEGELPGQRQRSIAPRLVVRATA